MNRICLFIDGSHFYYALKRNQFQTRVNYYELSKALAGPDRELVKTYYFNSAYDPLLSPEAWKAQQPFLESLIHTPYLELALGRIVPSQEGGNQEKGSAIRLASDLIYTAARNLYDTAIVITEDAEFAGALEQVKLLGRQVEIGLFSDFEPRALVAAADLVIPMKEVLERYARKIFPTPAGERGTIQAHSSFAPRRVPA